VKGVQDMRGFKRNVLAQLGGKMPIRRRALTKIERAEYLVRAEQLRASGLEIEPSEKSGQQDPSLDVIVGPPTANTVCELRSGGIVYVPFVRLVARSRLTLTDCDISTSYDDQIVLESFHDDPICRLGRAEYWQDEALNQQMEDGLVLSRGQMVEGYILASGLRRIPRERGKFAVPFVIVFSDQFGDEFPAKGMFSVLRQAQPDNARVEKGSGLYGPDATGIPPEPSIGEQAGRRYLELLAQKKLAQQQKVPRWT
jgi:hypothetical protein